MEHRRQQLWVPTVVLAASGLLVSLQFTLTIPLLPAMPEILDVTSNDASWVVTMTLLSSAVATPILSRMADMYGKRRIILLSLVVISVGSVVITLGDSYATMLVGRALQGFGQALIPVGISLLRDLLPKARAGAAIALMSATLGIGSVLGLPLSGVLYESFGWQSIFWVTALTGVLAALATLLFVRESPVRAPARFDLVGAVLLSVALASTLLVISKAGQWAAPVVWGLAGIAVLSFAAWIPLQLQVNNPMVDLRTFARRPVLLTNVSSLFATVATFANMLITLQMVQAPEATGYGLGLSVTAAGLVMLPAGAAMVALAPISGLLLNRWGGRNVLVLGNAVMAAAFVLRVFTTDGAFAIAVGAALVGAGSALVFAAMPTILMASVPLTETASANGINALVRSVAMSVCSALLALLVSKMTVTVAGHEFLSGAAVQLCFWLAASSALVGAVIALLIRTEPRVGTSTVSVTGAEVLVRGRVFLDRGAAPRHPSLVTFMRVDGTPVDWSRSDNDGRYSALLPGRGQYVAVANTIGWAPRTRLLDVSGTEVECDFVVTHELSLAGEITHGGNAAVGAIVVLHRGQGEFVATARSDDAGFYQFMLPPAGPYLVTVIDGSGDWASSQKLIVGIESMNLDIDVRASDGDPVSKR